MKFQLCIKYQKFGVVENLHYEETAFCSDSVYFFCVQVLHA